MKQHATGHLNTVYLIKYFSFHLMPCRAAQGRKTWHEVGSLLAELLAEIGYEALKHSRTFHGEAVPFSRNHSAFFIEPPGQRMLPLPVLEDTAPAFSDVILVPPSWSSCFVLRF